MNKIKLHAEVMIVFCHIFGLQKFSFARCCRPQLTSFPKVWLLFEPILIKLKRLEISSLFNLVGSSGLGDLRPPHLASQLTPFLLASPTAKRRRFSACLLLSPLCQWGPLSNKVVIGFFKSTRSTQNKRTSIKLVLFVLVGSSGLEPPTPTLSGWCSNQLSYDPILWWR